MSQKKSRVLTGTEEIGFVESEEEPSSDRSGGKSLGRVRRIVKFLLL
ncbi:hypothetical protein ACFYKX_20580 [Cytobacillus sp. FJAT-54145]|uniref:Uncharacterized protein n=1 Tax=Cytobacillus spartinae TaxID=3299023 RepID=A0ABW6KFM5_9BACI